MTLESYLKSQREWVKDLLMGLLSVPSESGNEANAQDFLFKAIKGTGVEIKKVPIDDSIKQHPEYSDTVSGLSYKGRPNLLIEKRGTGGKIIALNTHMDVVPPSAGQIDPYVPRIDAEGKIFARGACDAKGQVAALALLFKAACEFSPLKSDIVGHIVVEEEFGGNGTLAMLESSAAFKADALINMEPTDLRIMPSIRGAVWFDMSFTGESGHAGSTGRTQNAIYKAMAAIDTLRSYHAELLKRSAGYGLFKGIPNPMPLTIGEFSAGDWPSMVPGKARIRGVMGFLPNTTRENVISEIQSLFYRPDNLWVKEGMSIRFNYRHDAVETPVKHWFVKGMSEACSKCCINEEPAAMTASTDATYYQRIGVPSLAFGPGRISDAHSCHEQISLDDILKAAEVMYTFIDSVN